MTEPDQTESAYASVLFRFDAEGGNRFGFAVPYRYTPIIASERMKRGRITCADGDQVFLGFDSQNRLDSYRVTDGALLWHATFDGINVPLVRERLGEDGRRYVGIDVRGSKPILHFLLGISGGKGGPLIVQFGRRTKQEILAQTDTYVVETFLVDPQTGEGLYIGEGFPEVLSLEVENLLLIQEDPFPRVEVSILPP